MSSMDIERKRLGRRLLFPALIATTIVVIPALLFNLGVSFFDWRLVGKSSGDFIGLDHYIEIFTSPQWMNSIGRTLIFVGVSVAVQVTVGFAAAYVLYRHFPKVRWIQATLLIPMMISEVAAALAWKYFLGTDGSLLNWFIGLFGVTPQQWLGTEWAFATVIGVDIWIHTPFVILVLFAAMQGMPPELLEAAEVDGAKLRHLIRQVIIPLIAPSLLVVLVFRTVFAFRAFATIWLLTGGGPANRTAVLGIEIYRTGFFNFNTAFAAALAVLLLVISLITAFIYTRMLGRESLS